MAAGSGVLIVQDDFLVAQRLRGILEGAGETVAGIARDGVVGPATLDAPHTAETPGTKEKKAKKEKKEKKDKKDKKRKAEEDEAPEPADGEKKKKKKKRQSDVERS